MNPVYIALVASLTSPVTILPFRVRIQLKKVKAQLETDVAMVIADTSNMDSLNAMAKRAKVIITTVGPYLKYGISLVEACAKNGTTPFILVTTLCLHPVVVRFFAGTSYVDLTGEGPFVKWSEAKYDATAKENKCSIVHCCGYGT